MSALFGILFAKALPYLLMALAAVAAFFGVRKAGADKERAKQAKARLDDISEAKTIEDAIAGKSEAEIRKEASKWAKR